MEKITTVGLDLAKSVFQVHGIAEEGAVIVRRALRRSQVLDFFRKLQPCLVGMEACGSAHYWAWEIQALRHTVRLMPPAYVKAYLKRNKTDAADAEAICEAVTRPTMRHVPAKTQDEQAAGMVLKARDLLIRQRTQSINALRAHLAELGIVRATGLVGIISLAAIVRDESDLRLPGEARMALEELVEQIETVTARIERLDRKILETVRKDDSARRLTAIPGVGPIIAATIRAVVQDPAGFRTGRDFAAWIGFSTRAFQRRKRTDSGLRVSRNASFRLWPQRLSFGNTLRTKI
ncbi:Transposase [Agrobacterium sp. DSM 25558]|nr:Transposase [Agrobacterium sp. DSM 25558]